MPVFMYNCRNNDDTHLQSWVIALSVVPQNNAMFSPREIRLPRPKQHVVDALAVVCRWPLTLLARLAFFLCFHGTFLRQPHKIFLQTLLRSPVAVGDVEHAVILHFRDYALDPF